MTTGISPPWQVRVLSEMGRTRFLRRARRWAWVRKGVGRALRRLADADRRAPDDLTVLIGVRNRSDHRLVNSLRSLRNQVYPYGRIRPLVIDYGSDPDPARQAADICKRHGADHLRVEVDGPWSRARCLNHGLCAVTTKYVATSDVDMVFSTSYFADAVAILRDAPLSIVCAPMLDLPEESQSQFQRAAEVVEDLDLESWRDRAIERFEGAIHPSLGTGLTAWYRLIGGYDEYFETWGGEDRDLMERFTNLGLEQRPIEGAGFYLHQWHPKFEGVAGGAGAGVIIRNRRYFRDNHTILRNGADRWSPADP